MKYKSSYASAFADLLGHSVVLCFSFYLMWYFKNSLFSVFTVPLFATMKVRTFIIFHDCCHNSYTPNKMLNYIISHITGTLISTSPNWILDHHIHHLTNGNIENKQHFLFNETVMVTKKQFSTHPKQSQFRLYKHPFVFFVLIPMLYFGILQRFLYTYKKYKRPHIFEKSFMSITFNHLVNNVLTFFYIYKMYNYGLLIQYICVFIIFGSMSFMMFHNQHTYNPPYVVGNTEWSQKNSGLIGSSFMNFPRLLKYFYMGIEYHHIHHMNSKIPGYNLQKYHEEVVSKSNMFDNIVTLSMRDCYNNLWLTLYDEDTNRYITLHEYDSQKKNA
jgi:omega-6 fatty acid desaturase (delta-12 desaturase)